MARHRRRRKGLFSKIGKAFKGVGKGIGNVAGFAVLLPFQVAMRALLRKHGVKPERGIGKLAQQFYNVIILKRSSYEIHEPEHLAGEIVATVVKAVIGFFKDLKKKKDSGEELSPAEDKALEAAEKATKEVIEPTGRAVRAAAVEEGKSKLFVPLAIAAGLLILVLITQKKK